MLHAAPEKLRVFVVGASPVDRAITVADLTSDPEIAVVGQAPGASEALRLIDQLRPDVITVEVGSADLSCLQALREGIAYPAPVVVVCPLAQDASAIGASAMQFGASAWVTKPALKLGFSAERDPRLRDELKLAGAASREPGSPGRGSLANTNPARVNALKLDRVVVIAASTGGPSALEAVCASLPGDFPAPILIVQHMPGNFTEALAKRLDAAGALSVREATSGQDPEPGLALVAPGGKHLSLRPDCSVRLAQHVPGARHRPSADVAFNSVAAAVGGRAIGVVLTGMGSDGTTGAAAIRRAGGHVVVQRQDSCVVYGMPRSAIEAGLATVVVPLNQIGQELARLCARRSSEGVQP